MNTLPTVDDLLHQSQAITDIKQLQYRLGYLLDAGDWDGAASLFSEDAVLHVGHHRPRAGRDEIRQHLPQAYALDFGMPATPPDGLGFIRAHLQIMPVVTLGPWPDLARATWRNLGCGGGPGMGAYWTEGPQEVAYRCTDGTWQIRSLRWFRTFAVPYAGGWVDHADQTAPTGAEPADQPRPSTQDGSADDIFQSWPAARRTPFHFLEHKQTALRPVTTAMQSRSTVLDPASRESDRTVGRQVQALETIRILENLQSMLGYYLDKGQWSQGAGLFTQDCRVAVGDETVARGHSEVLALFHAMGPAGPAPGRLLDLIHLQPVIVPTASGVTAQGQWKVFAQLALSGRAHEWGLGELTAQYARTPHGWRISELRLHGLAFTDYDLGWGHDLRPWSRILPSATAQGGSARPIGSAQGPNAPEVDHLEDHVGITEVSLRRRLEQLTSIQSVERLQYVYGYCLAEFLWDELVDLFTEDGTIEIALRGVYRGRHSIRRSLELYGSAPEYGVLHNHMQFQPVIHLVDEGTEDTPRPRAFIRCRALSMMGRYGSSSMWMGGVYENSLTQRDGQWLMERDRVVNTYFAPYDVGWRDLAARPAPGVSAQIPPDEPPSGMFEMYPEGFLVPYHYPDPDKDGGSDPVDRPSRLWPEP